MNIETLACLQVRDGASALGFHRPGKHCLPPSVKGARGGTHVMHGRSRMAIDPRIPPMLGRSSPGFHGPGMRWGGAYSFVFETAHRSHS